MTFIPIQFLEGDKGVGEVEKDGGDVFCILLIFHSLKIPNP